MEVTAAAIATVPMDTTNSLASSTAAVSTENRFTVLMDEMQVQTTTTTTSGASHTAPLPVPFKEPEYTTLFPRVTDTNSPTKEHRERKRKEKAAVTKQPSTNTSQILTGAGPNRKGPGGRPPGFRVDAKRSLDQNLISAAQYRDILERGISLQATLAANKLADQARHPNSAPAAAQPAHPKAPDGEQHDDEKRGQKRSAAHPPPTADQEAVEEAIDMSDC